jgi:hypothetical protein
MRSGAPDLLEEIVPPERIVVRELAYPLISPRISCLTFFFFPVLGL